VLSAVDLVEIAVKYLEDDPLFNAGRGAVLNREGVCEMEASIMDGRSLSCGAASLIKTIRNPISVARLVMEKTEHNYIVGPAAETLALAYGLESVDPNYFITEKRIQQFKESNEKNIVSLDHNDNDNDNDMKENSKKGKQKL
jgi:beta-aspartyl-peptidase (threonine type)